MSALGQALCYEKDGEAVVKQGAFKDLGIMIDCARNAVFGVESVKRFVISSALMGYNYFELYVEDCFEVDGEPYFGYMRSRYKKSELKLLSEFCCKLGVELVPCIQTLAHLARIFLHWQEYTLKIQDKGDVLLVGDERTYLLIENMIKTCRECFSSSRINIGMDEAFELGKGKYFRQHGYVPSSVIIREHLEKVRAICKKYGFSPSLWADMFYDEIDSGKVENIPSDINLICWEYYTEDEKPLTKRLLNMQKAGVNYSFAGGAHKWFGMVPHNAYAEIVLKNQIKSCKKAGVTDFKLTLWGDDGGECSNFTVLPAIAYLAQENIKQRGFANSIIKLLTGYTKTQFMALDLPNKLYDAKIEKILNPSKYLLFVDGFIGVEEFSSSPDYRDRYRAISRLLKGYARKKSWFSHLFKTFYTLCDLLELKSTLTEDIDLAYKTCDKAGLKEICYKTIPEVLKRLKKFITAYKEQWLKENRPLGLEVQEHRLYGVKGRLESVKQRLDDYLSGKVETLPELEEIKLSPKVDPNDKYNGCRLYNGFNVTVTYGAMYFQ